MIFLIYILSLDFLSLRQPSRAASDYTGPWPWEHRQRPAEDTRAFLYLTSVHSFETAPVTQQKPAALSRLAG